jgi:hypothetical protein
MLSCLAMYRYSPVGASGLPAFPPPTDRPRPTARIFILHITLKPIRWMKIQDATAQVLTQDEDAFLRGEGVGGTYVKFEGRNARPKLRPGRPHEGSLPLCRRRCLVSAAGPPRSFLPRTVNYRLSTINCASLGAHPLAVANKSNQGAQTC